MYLDIKNCFYWDFEEYLINIVIFLNLKDKGYIVLNEFFGRGKVKRGGDILGGYKIIIV